MDVVNDLRLTRDTGGPVACENCDALETEAAKTDRDYRHKTVNVSGTRTVLCKTCQIYYSRKHQLRTPRQMQRLSDLNRLQADREAGVPIICHYCRKRESTNVAPNNRYLSSPKGRTCRTCNRTRASKW